MNDKVGENNPPAHTVWEVLFQRKGSMQLPASLSLNVKYFWAGCSHEKFQKSSGFQPLIWLLCDIQRA